MTDRHDLAAELKAAGFSTRAANGIAYGAEISSVDELRNAPWGDWQTPDGLFRRILVAPNCGRKAAAEVMAFREGKDPRAAIPTGRYYVSAPFNSDEIAALDAWIARQDDTPSRSEAIRRILAKALKQT